MASPKRVFISYSVDDTATRDLLVERAAKDFDSLAFTSVGTKEPWDEQWKRTCRARIKDCQGVIALLSKSTNAETGNRWEIACAVQEGVPIVGVHIHATDKGEVPPELHGKPVINWGWSGIGCFLSGL